MTDTLTQPTMNDRRWQSVRSRQPDPTDPFLYAVATTGVYCRVGCASRAPLRKNVEFFASAAEAAEAGYRPCLRCRPDAADGESGRGEQQPWVRAACRRLEEAGGASVPLAELAAEAGLSASHFQRRFKQALGISPRQYAEQLRERRFRSALQQAASVTDAIYKAGYNSAGRAYDGVRGRLGMTPTALRKGAPRERIRHTVAQSTLGAVLVAATEVGICAIYLGDDEQSLIAQLRDSFAAAELEPGDGKFQQTAAAVVSAIEEPAAALALPLDIRGTAFQKRVWEALRGLKVGETASYTEIATRIGSPRAVRAVASACAANQLAVAVPCHRVVRGDGQSGEYRWGARRKQSLLARESSDSAGGPT